MPVALLAEGVGRNIMGVTEDGNYTVALLAEGVGRNLDFGCSCICCRESPSSRRAWVEMHCTVSSTL